MKAFLVWAQLYVTLCACQCAGKVASVSQQPAKDQHRAGFTTLHFETGASAGNNRKREVTSWPHTHAQWAPEDSSIVDAEFQNGIQQSCTLADRHFRRQVDPHGMDSKVGWQCKFRGWTARPKHIGHPNIASTWAFRRRCFASQRRGNCASQRHEEFAPVHVHAPILAVQHGPRNPSPRSGIYESARLVNGGLSLIQGAF